MSFQADARTLRQAITSFGTISTQVCGIADMHIWTPVRLMAINGNIFYFKTVTRHYAAKANRARYNPWMWHDADSKLIPWSVSDRALALLLTVQMDSDLFL